MAPSSPAGGSLFFSLPLSLLLLPSPPLLWFCPSPLLTGSARQGRGKEKKNKTKQNPQNDVILGAAGIRGKFKASNSRPLSPLFFIFQIPNMSLTPLSLSLSLSLSLKTLTLSLLYILDRTAFVRPAKSDQRRRSTSGCSGSNRRVTTATEEKLWQTRELYATFNAMSEIKVLMLKKTSLLNSISSQVRRSIGSSIRL